MISLLLFGFSMCYIKRCLVFDGKADDEAVNVGCRSAIVLSQPALMSQVRCKLLDGIRDHQRPAHLLSWDAEFLCWLSGCDVFFAYITACLDQYSVLLGQQSLFTSTEPVLLKTTVKDRWYILKLECKVTSWYGIKDHWNNWTNHTLEGCWDARLFQYFWKFEKV